MGKVNRDDFRSQVLSADDIEEAAVLTISAYNEGDRKDGGGKWALVRFEETGDKPFFLTGGAIDALIANYGDDSDNWIGKQVPLEQYAGKEGPAIRMMAEEEWDEAFQEAGVRPVGRAARSAPRAATAARPVPGTKKPSLKKHGAKR